MGKCPVVDQENNKLQAGSASPELSRIHVSGALGQVENLTPSSLCPRADRQTRLKEAL